jgi:membrane protease YdiL (CAAX protease family)
MMKKWNQGKVFLVMLCLYALSAFLTYAFFADQLVAMLGMPMPDMGLPMYVVGLANAGIIFVVYGILGIVGIWFARRLDLPGVYVENSGWRQWFWMPFLIGICCGFALVVGDLFFAGINDFGRSLHPGFPASILASVSAGIGEEIAFRGFVFGLWGLILNWVFRGSKGKRIALWAANVIAAIAFGAGHLGSLLFLTGATTISEINPVLLVEIFLLNGIVGLVAGERYMKDGLLAAAGVHFWTDAVFHVGWGLM